MIVIKVTLWITIINFVIQFKNTFMLSVWNLSLVVLIVSSLITVQYFYKQSFFLQLLNLTHTFFVKLNFPLSFLYVTIETLLSHLNSNVLMKDSAERVYLTGVGEDIRNVLRGQTCSRAKSSAAVFQPGVGEHRADIHLTRASTIYLSI